MTSADSFMMEIKTDDFYEDIKNSEVKDHKDQFDLSNYDKDHHSGLECEDKEKKAKGVKSRAVKKQKHKLLGLRELFNNGRTKECNPKEIQKSEA
ncbi:Hypothetical predicted protein [Paramuricea clavata]|uniref:Uncharacterized protein n=1 Tax=Paramuricea clavata TaxID=317549 RepID=A0A6S7HCL1_PARCT|nr:Hypothetical predicted protein [Paramuricea clavata]